MATSIGITVRVLRDLGFHRRRSVTIVLGAAVLDDVLGLLGLGLVTAIALGEADTVELALLAVQAVIFVFGFGIAGQWIVARLGEQLARHSPSAIFEMGIVVAGITLAAGAVTEDVYAPVLGMVPATTIICPYRIKAVFAGGRSAGPEADALLEPHSSAPETPAETVPAPAGDE